MGTFTRTTAQIEAIHNTVSDPSTNQAFTDAIGEQVIPKYTDIVYKASGGNSAVENMVLGVPIAIGVGETCQCENGTIFKKISSFGGISDFEPQSGLHWKDFGVIGTGYPLDDGPALNFYASSCRDNSWALNLPHTGGKVKIYTTETIDLQGVDVHCDKPSIIDFGSRPEDSFGFSILTGLPSGRPSASSVYGMDYRFGDGVCLYSDVASPVVKISSKRKLSIGVSGWLGLAGQHCIEDEFNGDYQTVVFPWGEVLVSGAGDDGIALNNGIEISEWSNVTAKHNNGHGVNTAGGGGDNNQEYFSARFCNFVANRLDGFNMSKFKKNVSFYKCGLNSNGWYGYGPSESVLKPTSPRDAVGGVKISGVITSAPVLSFVENYGEDCARIASLFLDYPIRNLEFRKNNLFPTLNLTDPNADLNNHLLGLFSLSGGSVGQIYDAEIDQNAAQNTSRSKIITGDIMPTNLFDFYIGPNQTLDPNSYDFSDFSRIINNKFVLSEELTLNKHVQAGRDSIGDGTDQTFVSTYIKDNLRDSGQGNNSWSVGSCFLLTANWQATNAQLGGAYLIYAFALPDGQVRGESISNWFQRRVFISTNRFP